MVVVAAAAATAMTLAAAAEAAHTLPWHASGAPRPWHIHLSLVTLHLVVFIQVKNSIFKVR